MPINQKAKTMKTQSLKQLLQHSLIAGVLITGLIGCTANTPNKSVTDNQTTDAKADVIAKQQKPAKQDTSTTDASSKHSAKDKMYDKYQTPPIIARPTVMKGQSAPTSPQRIEVMGQRVTSTATQNLRVGDQFDQPPEDEQGNHEKYADTTDKLNPVYQTRQTPVSTFSIDVDTASYTNVRRMLNQGHWPQPGAVRVEEMINYFNYDYAAPQSAEQPFAVHAEVAPSPWNPSTHLMRIALKGYQVNKDNLPPMNLVFLIDVSGSMFNANKLPLLKQAFSLLTRQLRSQDHVSIVVYAGASGLVLKPTSGDKQDEILAALEQLQAGGSTNGGAGIKLAYATAKSHFKKAGINRVILATDGDFNVGTTNQAQLLTLIEQQKQSRVFLSILGFGQGNYNDHLMETLSNKGNGNAYYIDSFKEARKVFSDGLTATMQTIAKDVKLQVEFNPNKVTEYRLIGYDNRKLNREDFNNDKVDAGDIGAGHTVTAFYEVVLKGSDYHFSDPLRYQKTTEKTSASQPLSQSGELAFVKLRYKKPDEDRSQLITLAIADTHKVDRFEQASSDFKFAAAVTGFAETLRDSQYINWSLAQIAQTAQANLQKDTWGYRHEFVQLTQNALAIKPDASH
jgi:Ca-activated chloride channel family protein